jgi:hypothetical protein
MARPILDENEGKQNHFQNPIKRFLNDLSWVIIIGIIIFFIIICIIPYD